MTDPGVDGSVRGRLLVAGPSLDDPNFARTVVFVIEHTDAGAVGVVLNRPSEIPVTDALETFAPVAAEPARIFIGGPVEPGSVIALGRLTGELPDDVATPVLDRIGVLDLTALADGEPGTVAELRLFAGHAGWAPGQLDGELRAGGWLVVDAEPGDLRTDRPDDLWQAVLGRQSDPWVRIFSRYPADPSAN